jgi:hypothetical protein
MLLPQTRNKSKADSSLSISMQLSTPDALRHTSVPRPAMRVLAGALFFASLASPVVAAVEVSTVGGSIFAASVLAQSWTGFVDWIAASYSQAPALVLGLVALIVVPLLALIGLWISRRGAEPVEVSEARTQVRRVARGKTAEARDTVRTGHIPLRPLEAWVEVVNVAEVSPTSPDPRYSLARTLLRIGRETDNDICLQDKTVHRYHAAIHRTEDAEFVITDLSSARGNGVVVNGRPVAEARLASGDLIELGKARLKFSAAHSG